MKNSKYRINSANGIDEKIYASINGQKQYVFIRGKDIKNPVILYLHGGPANPDSFMTYELASELCEQYTFIAWDQRGCGRTYYANKSIDKENTTATFEQAIMDVDELVKYLCKRFDKEKIIIMGHSYGTLLGISYVYKYPELVDKYIGIGQSVSLIDTQKENYYEVLEMMKVNKIDTSDLVKCFDELSKNMSITNLMSFQRKTGSYYKNKNVKHKNQLKLIINSPDFSFTDFKWIIGMLNINNHYMKNKQLFDYSFMTNIKDIGYTFSIPMLFISGDYDKNCSVNLLKEYYQKIIAPIKDIVIMDDYGHSPQIDAPIQFTKELTKLLQK